jgi:hypothetical protein
MIILQSPPDFSTGKMAETVLKHFTWQQLEAFPPRAMGLSVPIVETLYKGLY